MDCLPACIFSLALAIGLIGCENCGPSAEPLATVVINTSKLMRLDTLYSPDSRLPLPAQPTSQTVVSTYRQLTLPINLTADSTRYVIQLSGQRDTITVFYERRTTYRNQKCGYILDLYEPKKLPMARVTRGKITSLNYLQNRDATIVSQRSNTTIHG